MKRWVSTIFLITLIWQFCPCFRILLAQIPVDSVRLLPVSFVDKNKDGINDVFADANGDGKNDVTNQPYGHQFEFQDQNRDGLNDRWQDKDGDGVNDLFSQQLKQRGIQAKNLWIDRDGDGIIDADARPKYEIDLRQFVLDLNQDGKNDVTGCDVTEDNIMGYRYGIVDEEKNNNIQKYLDKDGDGMHDPFLNRLKQDLRSKQQARSHDLFIDRDGDGIADDRGFGQLKKETRQQNRVRKGNR